MLRLMKKRAVRCAWRVCAAICLFATGCHRIERSDAIAQAAEPGPASRIERNYAKSEHMIPMRDGVRLFTQVYAPKDQSRTHPMLLLRTPYAVDPYGADAYRNKLGSGDAMAEERFIFVYQDVRGRFMSEGEYVNMTPHIADKSKPTEVDESSDTYDTIEWLIHNVPNHNGRVGMWGISYPGFYAAAGMIDAHPALAAVSPQAPVADWWFDDFHHHGAFFFPHLFNFIASFGQERKEPTTEWPERFKHGTPDGYQFFLDIGPIKNANERHFHHEIPFWDEFLEHPNYDAFWRARNILPHLKGVAPAVMTVGGWFDAEDLYGALSVYRETETNNPGVFNILVMGPWQHGGWGRMDGDRLGNISFGDKTSLFYRNHIELPFFRHFLKGTSEIDLPEAYVFETGANRWRRFDRWPPETEAIRFYCHGNGRLAPDAPNDGDDAHDEYTSDPDKPVPYTEAIAIGMTKEYMTDDQRFAARRPDVLAYQTDALDADVTIAGPVMADLWCSTSGTDSDWIVKLIDVFPSDAPDHDELEAGQHMGGYQMMVRSEVMRGRFRNSYERPEPFVPDEPTAVRVPLQDVLHTFRKGHRIMVQIQSTWFPLVDRNPQTFVDNIYLANEEDFVKATQRVHRSGTHPSRIELGRLNGAAAAPK
ncbi:MAG: CocE/NonD family hydrolase [Phycisphaerales bacterium]|nr:CocE/NonD family hydrolase [Phycisphaerales bacterium]